MCCAWCRMKEIIIVFIGSPKDVATDQVSHDISAVAGVVSVHDLHIWTLSPGNTALTVHVLASDEADSGNLLHRIGEVICSKHGIHHSTIQIEHKEGFHCNPSFCSTRQQKEHSIGTLKAIPIAPAV